VTVTPDPITIYFSEHGPLHRREEDLGPGWWWCVANYDPEGPFDTCREAVESLATQMREHEENA